MTADGLEQRRPLKAGEIRDRLKAEHPDWDIWYVHGSNRTITWCARRKPLLSRLTPDELADAIKAAENSAGPAENDRPAGLPIPR